MARLLRRRFTWRHINQRAHQKRLLLLHSPPLLLRWQREEGLKRVDVDVGDARDAGEERRILLTWMQVFED